MAKSKRISITSLEKAIGLKDVENIIDIEWRGLTVSVRRTLPLSDMMQFVSNVVSSCFSDEGEYLPEVRDFITKVCMVDFYTNISLPEDLGKKYIVIYASDVIDMIRDNINMAQLEEMENSIKVKLDHVSNAHIEEVHKSVGRIIEMFENFQEELTSLTKDISPDQITKILGAIDNMSETELMKASH